MIKILIADDEPIVIESIKFIIDKHLEKDFEIVGSALSGKEAIEKALLLKPDLVLVDIHMPGINGIEVIRHLRGYNRDLIFIILTAYEHFQYAREAVNLGVYEYMLKPINKNRLVNVLKEARSVISSKRKSVEKETALMDKIGKIVPHLEGQFIYSQLFRNQTVGGVDFFEDIFGMSLREGYVVVLVLNHTEVKTKEEGLISSLLRQNFFERFKSEVKNSCSCLVGIPLLDQIVVYIPGNEPDCHYDARNKTIELVKKVCEKAPGNYKIGIGRHYSIADFHESYHEAHLAALYPGGDLINHFEDINRISPVPVNTYDIKEKELLHLFALGDLPGTMEHFEGLYSWLVLDCKDDRDKIKFKLLELFIMIQRLVPAGIYEVAGSSDYLSHLLKTSDLAAIKISCAEYLQNTIKKMKEHRKQRMNGLAGKALQYIEQNYHKNINLNDAAKTVNMSYHYFSKFFKESTGKKFSDYITEIRMEKAMKHLKDADFNIKAICYEVGYSDPNYFCKIFKKKTGMTPSEYRSRVLMGEVTSDEITGKI